MCTIGPRTVANVVDDTVWTSQTTFFFIVNFFQANSNEYTNYQLINSVMLAILRFHQI